MPDGVVQWYDPATGEGRILSRGRRFTLRAASSEPGARVPGSRVHFDVDRGVGERTALDVRLRRGHRSGRHHRRHGDLVGRTTADSGGDPPSEHPQGDIGRDLSRQPLRVAERWAALLASGELDEALMLYAPDATLHSNGSVARGLPDIRRHWAASHLLAGPNPRSVRGEGEVVLISWSGTRDHPEPMQSRMLVVHGEIREQWVRAEWVVEPVEELRAPVELSTEGVVSERDRVDALDRIGRVLDTLEEPVLHTSLRLSQAPDPARERPALARVSVDLNGRPVRAHVAAAEMREAIDLLQDRLERRVRTLEEHRRALRLRTATSPSGTWQHGDLATDRPAFHPRPAAEREIVRHKSWSTTESTVDEAVFDLESLDHDFLLFTDLANGQDAVVARRDDGTYELQHLDGSLGSGPTPSAAHVEVVDRPAPGLRLHEAREHLDIGGAPRVFYRDAATGRGHVLYRRYDGHYGLIVPVDESVDVTEEHPSGPRAEGAEAPAEESRTQPG